MSNVQSGEPVARQASRRRVMAAWLFVIAAMVFAMVVLGGVTRLTNSGLSMVEWRPLTGWLPPFNEADWQRLFEKYQAYPEFRKMNAGMTLIEFEGIFWLEFIHRLWGRAIGVAFFVPFLIFALRGWIDRALAWRFAVMFIGGGLQGAMGWYMVKSGLVDHPDVSQYRLAAHLIIALALYAYILWVAISMWRAGEFPDAPASLRQGAAWLLTLIFVTAFSGALVAGLDAGLTYNTFPLMDGALVPDGILDMSPVHLNFFENIATVQFDHRVLAVTTFLAVLAFWAAGLSRGAAGRLRLALNAMAVMVCIQVALGISTLLLVVPVPLAALHQAGAVLLIGIAVWALRETFQGAK